MPRYIHLASWSTGAYDGIDAAYSVYIDDAETVLNIYTDKYSNCSKEVTANSSDVNYSALPAINIITRLSTTTQKQTMYG